MAISSKGWRTMDGGEWVWKATGTDDGIAVVISRPEVFERGTKVPMLRCLVPHPVAERWPVTPRFVRRVIDLILPDGGLTRGGSLPHWTARALAADEPVDLWDESLAAVARWRQHVGPGTPWMLATALMDLGALRVLDPGLRAALEPGEHGLVDTIALMRERRLPDQAAMYRSALAYLGGDCPAELDAELRQGSPRHASIPRQLLVPEGHEWWRWV